MTQAVETTINSFEPEASVGIFKRLAVLMFGLTGYTAGNIGLFWAILAIGGFAPAALSDFKADNIMVASLINIGLVTLFGLQHSLMARQLFKDWLTQYIPQAAERSAYMLMSGLAMIAVIYFWQPVVGTIWSVENIAGQVALWCLYALGWGYLVLSTFVTNHFELMGLRQIYLYVTQQPYTRLPFTRKYMYRYSRHPMMLGVLIGMWSVPVMTVTHFIMVTLFTVYMVVGVSLEERDLLKNFGDTYRKYKKEIATFIPGIF